MRFEFRSSSASCGSKRRARRRWLDSRVVRSLVAVGLACLFLMPISAALALDLPATALSIAGTPGLNGFYITDPVVTLTRDQPGTTYYSFVSGAGPWTTYFGPFTVGEGSKTLWYYSADPDSNAEAVKSQLIMVDTTPPNAGIASPAQESTVSGVVPILGTASDVNFASFKVEYGAGKRPLPAETDVGNLMYSTWWRQIGSSSTAVVGGALGSWDTLNSDNSYHTLRLVAQDMAGNTTVRLRIVKVGNDGRPWMDEVTVDALDFVPDISADGQKVAFSSDRLGNQDIWMASGSGTLLGAVATSPARDRHPSFSPDGQSIAFMSDRDGSFDIWRVNVDGTGLSRLTSDPGEESVPVWSPDGQKIVYASDAAGNRDICIMNSDGTGQTLLTSDPADDWLPDISPDGARIAFVSDRSGMRDIMIMNADGTGSASILALPGGETHPTFSPDGQKLAFVAGTSDASVWTANVDGTDLKRLTSDPAPDALPTWSANGGKIVFASGRSGLCDIYTMDPDGANQRRVTFSVDDFIPDVNRDSSKMAFASNRARGNGPINWYDIPRGDLFLIDPDGTDMSRLAGISSYSTHPSFSPDGNEIAFASEMSGAWDVWKMKLDGSGLTQLTTGTARENVPTWGPNGRIVYASNPAGNEDTFIMNADGTSQTAVTTDASEDTFPDITANGCTVGFSSDRFGPGDVFTVRPDGANLTRLTPDSTANEWHPSFGPGGTKLTFVYTATNTDVYMMNVDGSDWTRLTHDAALDTVNTWGADGTTAVFSTSRTSGEAGRKSIWRMTMEPDPVAPPVDSTAPVTSLSANPASPNGDNGWYVTDPVVTLTADEPGTTYYSFVSDTGPWTTYAGPFGVGEGEKTLWYYSVDAAANAEVVKEGAFKVDTTPPVVDISSPAQGATVPAVVSVSGGTEADARITLTASDGVTTLPFAAIAGPDGAWAVTNADLSSLAEGTIAFEATAADQAGNTSTVVTRTATKYTPAAPIVGAIVVPFDPMPVGAAISVMAPFIDANPSDTHVAVWTWADGSSSSGDVVESGGIGTTTASHTFTTPGVYTVDVTVTDVTGLSGTSTATQYVVVYDPNGGFVTGGGWITSPPGAYRASTALTGRANFGFVSRYKNGATVPTGETEFQFQLGDLNFHSENYSWLVIAGGKAQYKGTGTINGNGRYGFMLTAVDGAIRGGADTFRIKIWDLDNNDAVVYDNHFGDPDSAEPTTVLRGGSIVIHK